MRCKPLWRFSIAVLLLASGGLAVVPVEGSDVDKTVIGVWKSASFDDYGWVERPECPAISVTERTLTLKAVPGKNSVQGDLVRWTRRVWATTENACRWYAGEPHFEPIFGAVWRYAVTGKSDEHEHHVPTLQGKYLDCDGSACSQWTQAKEFTTELKLVSDTLIDRQPADPTGDIEFMRLSDDDGVVDEARSAAVTWLKVLDQGQLDQFYDHGTTAAFRGKVTRDSFRKSWSDFQSRTGRTTSREYLISTHLFYAPMIAKGRSDYVLFSNKATMARGVSRLEFVLLAREGGEWKVCWLA